MYDVMNKTSQLIRLMWLSRPLMQRVEDLVRVGLEGTGLTVRMRAVLEILKAKGPLSVPDIGRELLIQRQYVQVMVNEVLAAGFAEKRNNPRHRSSSLIALTSSGLEVISTVLAREQRNVELLDEAYSQADVAAALRVVERLCDQIDEYMDSVRLPVERDDREGKNQ